MNNNIDYLSEFQFKGSIIRELNFENDFVSLPKSDDLDTSIDVKNAISDIDDNNGKLYANVLLALTVIAKRKNVEANECLKIDFTIEGRFSYALDNKEQFERMLALNGTSTLYSIARAHIATITSMSLLNGKINLPMVNFVKLFQMQRKQELENNKDLPN